MQGPWVCPPLALAKRELLWKELGGIEGSTWGDTEDVVTWMPKGIFSPKVTAPPEVRALSNFFPPLPQPPPLFPAHGKLSTYMLYEYWKEYVLYTHTSSHMSFPSLDYLGSFPLSLFHVFLFLHTLLSSRPSMMFPSLSLLCSRIPAGRKDT